MTPPRTRWVLLLGLVLSAASLHGQGTEEGAPAPATPRGGVRVLPVGGVRYGAPLGASLYGGVIVGTPNSAGYHGPSLLAEAGQDGMRVSLGGSSIGLSGTFRGQLSWIRSWDDHGDVRAGQSYAGPELVLGILAGVTLGHYWRIGDGGGDARVLSLGTFIGF